MIVESSQHFFWEVSGSTSGSPEIHCL